MSDPHPTKNERRPDGAAFAIAAALLLVAVGIAWSTLNSGGVAISAPVGPKTFPYVVATGLFVLGVLTAVEAWRGDFPERGAQDLPPMIWIVGGLAAQLLTMKTLGFSIATGLLFAAAAKGFGKGPLWRTVPIGIAFSFVVWFVFAKGLQLSLPAGPLEQVF
ncbi:MULTISPECIES: tripartite tricarboxylate transporter TctB family protein [unclassified Mesorhizobium]|uniref:tripartite tricarboxylate transporter TctB family protein n=1 Tax=unclassified Mesorhizobium TaxID=325217 RepID=UPI000BB05213|nr:MULTISPECIES: tripartite tricarboxylate transporter TctB family protein [unclassified Mesorhizobium]TGT57233.1 tripartite tricarboxylate transporter TctB family protein [Mesorhizobium sp. M00.F.Ca.ET.170.01.1.1]AZO12014.1 tripartite tricarboxylate transporter TctB family protein [Mesorhizobium sp. M3A.F.Ca.ET.080.04.2.1]PBB86089.1 C4-dicarboxylate ABC transporter [Mesorhizobium sp. WSM3876]RWB66698.1 MAG: tripartite tricarboxylate transporter TctB family protein [Mesorhizobium sp.]RWB90649.